jgi:hypothetical protein
LNVWNVLSDGVFHSELVEVGIQKRQSHRKIGWRVIMIDSSKLKDGPKELERLHLQFGVLEL